MTTRHWTLLQAMASAGLTLTLAGCIGEFSSPPAAEEKVATLRFGADKLNALFAAECKAGKTCALPNTKDCQTLVVEVYGDGHTVGYCTLPEGGGVLRLTNPRDIPLQCRSSVETYSLQCLDWRANLALDVTAGDVAIYPARSSSSYQRFLGSGLGDLPAGSGFLSDQPGDDGKPPAPAPPSTPTAPPPPEASAACAAKAKDAFVKSLNIILKGEGLKFQYAPVKAGNSSGFFGNSAFQSNPALLCQQTQKPTCDKKAVPQGTCYCWVGLFGGTCKGAPMVDAALAASCAQLSAECPAAQWATTVWDESRGAITWLQAGQDANDAAQGAAALGAALGLAALLIMSDPLVLDLNDDGIALTAARDGVRFDLAGTGAAPRTAWVKGADDALLCLDVNGNGTIDDGRELFGDAFQLGGRRAGDGFEALALVDDPRNHGNGDGVVDANDQLYSKLRLWRDANGDGISQPGELTTLSSAGVVGLVVAPRAGGSSVDRHGNELAAGSFIRTSGARGMMADTFLVNR